MAASGNVVTDFLGRIFRFEPTQKLRLSQWSTLILGVGAIAFKQKDVLELMLLSYAFMVSGLFVQMGVKKEVHGRRPYLCLPEASPQSF